MTGVACRPPWGSGRTPRGRRGLGRATSLRAGVLPPPRIPQADRPVCSPVTLSLAISSEKSGHSWGKSLAWGCRAGRWRGRNRAGRLRPGRAGRPAPLVLSSQWPGPWTSPCPALPAEVRQLRVLLVGHRGWHVEGSPPVRPQTPLPKAPPRAPAARRGSLPMERRRGALGLPRLSVHSTPAPHGSFLRPVIPVENDRPLCVLTLHSLRAGRPQARRGPWPSGRRREPSPGRVSSCGCRRSCAGEGTRSQKEWVRVRKR